VLAAVLTTATLATLPAGALRPHRWAGGGSASPSPTTLTPRYLVFPAPQSDVTRGAAEAAMGKTVPLWSGSILATQKHKTYSFTMVGKDPTTPEKEPSVVVTVPLVPIVLHVRKAVFDPTVADTTCGEGNSDLGMIDASPIFNNVTYSPGGTVVGDTEYEDAFQRANFWAYTNPYGINPGYHVLVTPLNIAPITIDVPAKQGHVYSSGCQALGIVNLVWFDRYIRHRLLPELVANGVNPTTFPLFVTRNVVLDDHGCCVLGYHAETTTTASQFYGFTEYDDTGDFGPNSGDINTMAHEVGEWMDDPYGTNRTPPWGHTGQVAGCQANLEVGDPLSGTAVPVTSNGYTYHPQELAFFSWFFGQVPSMGVNGWYSSNGTFTGPATLCQH